MHEFGLTTDWLRVRLQASPEAPAVMTDGSAYTFRELDAMVSRLCGYLKREGVAAGEHVALLMPNSPAAVCAIFAMSRLGTTIVPLNTRLTQSEIIWQIKRADCIRILCSPTTEAVARQAAEDGLHLYVLPEASADLEAWLTVAPMSIETAPPNQNLHSLQAIQFTSGTTGFSKGAMITYANHLWGAIGSAFKLGVQTDDRWLVCMPLFHVGGMAILFRSCLYGTAIVPQRGFDEETIIRSLETEKITLISLVPTMLKRLLDAGLCAGRAPDLRLILLGGAAAPTDLLESAFDAGLPVAVTYGLTEATSQVATMRPKEARAKPGSPGRALLFSEVNIVDENGKSAAANQPGEVVVRGPSVMTGYYADDEATRSALRNGWFHTGDIGYLDDDGDLWILNRRSDLIVSGGENIYPAEVERVLRSHPQVAEVCVVGLPHADWGQQVAALVQLDRPGAIDGDELLDYCRKSLAGYKQPRLLVFTDEIPTTGSGKIHRHAVEELLANSMGQP